MRALHRPVCQIARATESGGMHLQLMRTPESEGHWILVTQEEVPGTTTAMVIFHSLAKTRTSRLINQIQF
jgi:hypothetical protein